jgi:hypothetical protein
MAALAAYAGATAYNLGMAAQNPSGKKGKGAYPPGYNPKKHSYAQMYNFGKTAANKVVGEEQLDEISKKKFKVAKKAFPNLLKNVRHKDMGCKEKNLDERKFDSREKIKGEPSFLGVPTTYIKGGSKKTFADTVLVSPKGYKGGGKVKRIPKSQYDPKKHNLAEEQLDEKAVSKSQQKLFGMALAMRRGESDRGSEKVASLAADLSQKKLRDFAKTKHKGLPGHVMKGKKK